MEFNFTLLIILFTCLTSIIAFSDQQLKMKTIFYPYRIKREREYIRFLSSGFLHANWLHLIVNMYVLYFFGRILEDYYSIIFGQMSRVFFILLYLLSIVAANMSTYFRQKDNPAYLSLGASGAVSAVLFATILFNPGMKIMFIFLPIPMPAIIIGVLYLIYSVFMANRSHDNINHEAHLLGAIFGFVFTLALKPEIWNIFIQQVKEII